MADSNFSYPPEASLVGIWIWECSYAQLTSALKTPESAGVKITFQFANDGMVVKDQIFDDGRSYHTEDNFQFDVGEHPDGTTTSDTLLFICDSRDALGGKRVRCNSEWLQLRSTNEIVDYFYRRFRW